MVRLDRGRERVGVHLVGLVDRDLDERRHGRGRASCTPCRSSCGPPSRRRRAGLPPSPRAARPARGGVQPARLAGRGERDQRRRGRRVREQAAEVAGRPSASRSQPTTTVSSSVPIGDVRHSIGFWPRAAVRNSPEHPRPRRGAREVRHEPRVLPVRGVGDHEAVDVGEDVGERLRPLRRAGREQGRDEPGSIGGRTGCRLDRGEVVGDPVDDVVGRGPECLRFHVVEAVDLLAIEAGLAGGRSPGQSTGARRHTVPPTFAVVRTSGAGAPRRG